MMYDFWYPSHFMSFSYGLSSILNVIFWVAFGLLMLSIWRNGGRFHRNMDVMDILRERYAKGEITKEQFESMKKDLEK